LENIDYDHEDINGAVESSGCAKAPSFNHETG